MKTEQKQEYGANWLTSSNLRKIAVWTIIFWGIIWTMAPWLDLPVVQPIYNKWVLTGQGLASFPMWGYSLLIRLLGSVTAVIIIQSLLGAFATAALLVRLNYLMPSSKSLTIILFITSLPWLSYMAYAYQMPISSSFMLLALLASEMAIRTRKIMWGVVAGILFGFGQNFRSELILLPGILLVSVYLLNKLKWVKLPYIKSLAVTVIVALLLQMPWALNCYFNAGRFSLSESNFGHVAYVGLGVPNNPWHIVPSDGFAQQTVTQAGLDCSSLSFAGGDFLKKKYIENICQNPSAYAKCFISRLRYTILQTFYAIRLSTTSAEQKVLLNTRNRDVLKWKNFTSIFSTDTEMPDDSVNLRKIAAIHLYGIVTNKIGITVSIFGIIGIFLAMGKGPFQISQPIILCLAVAVIYRFGMNVALDSSGKYMTGVYLCYLPFVANTIFKLSEGLSYLKKRLNLLKN